MTLVVGRVSGQRIAVASDTVITKHGMPQPISEWIVKTYMLPGGICASFANSPELAIKDFNEFIGQYPNGTNYADVIAFFERASSRSGNDYLIAFAKYAKLEKIVEGKRIKSIANTKWIGDKEGYERFREYETRTRKFTEAGRAINVVMFADEIQNSPASDLYSAMRHVVADRQVPTVGGLVYVVSDRLEVFRQSAYCDMLFDWPIDQSEDFKLDLNNQIDFGVSGENTNFAIAQASPSYLNLNVAVFYHLAARKLFVFCGRNDDVLMRCTVLQEVLPAEIVQRLHAHFGKDWGWLIQVMSAAETYPITKFREEPITEGPSGVSFPIFCHTNTFPRSKD